MKYIIVVLLFVFGTHDSIGQGAASSRPVRPNEMIELGRWRAVPQDDSGSEASELENVELLEEGQDAVRQSLLDNMRGAIDNATRPISEYIARGRLAAGEYAFENITEVSVSVGLTWIAGGEALILFLYMEYHNDGGKASTGPSIWAKDATTYSTYVTAAQKMPIGIGTDNPKARLHVEGDAAISSSLKTDKVVFSSKFSVQNSNGSSSDLLNISSGQVLVNTGTPVDDAKFLINGKSLFYSGNIPSKVSNYNVQVANGLITSDIGIVSTDQWPDFVFDEKYELLPLPELESYIGANGHLPRFPSAQCVLEKKQFVLNEHLIALLQQVEELTLYKIALKNKLANASHDRELNLK